MKKMIIPAAIAAIAGIAAVAAVIFRRAGTN